MVFFRTHKENLSSANLKIIVAVLDTGVDFNHEDLPVWRNPERFQTMVLMTILMDTLMMFTESIQLIGKVRFLPLGMLWIIMITVLTPPG